MSQPSAFARRLANVALKQHSMIVVEVGQDAAGRFAFCVGGNESDSVRRTTVRLDSNGFVKQRSGNSFISVIQNLK